jgi:hypothetical protein
VLVWWLVRQRYEGCNIFATKIAEMLHFFFHFFFSLRKQVDDLSIIDKTSRTEPALVHLVLKCYAHEPFSILCKTSLLLWNFVFILSPSLHHEENRRKNVTSFKGAFQFLGASKNSGSTGRSS